MPKCVLNLTTNNRDRERERVSQTKSLWPNSQGKQTTLSLNSSYSERSTCSKQPKIEPATQNTAHFPGSIYFGTYILYTCMRTSIAHMLWWVLMDVCFTSRMSVRWRNALWSLGVCFRAGFRVLWLRRRLLDVINAQHQQSRNQECPVLVKTDNHACMHARPKCMPVFLLLSSFKKCCFPAIPILLM